MTDIVWTSFYDLTSTVGDVAWRLDVQGLKCAVVVNDMAEVNIDASLVRDGGLVNTAGSLVEMQVRSAVMMWHCRPFTFLLAAAAAT